MRTSPGRRRRTFLCALTAALLGSVPAVMIAAPGNAVRQRTPAPYDLATDEKLGGHTLARHVGRSDAELAERLQRERNISAASTYPDESTAARVVGAAIAQSKGQLDTWVARRGPRPNLVLRYQQSTGPPIGRSLARGARSPQACHRALVVIRWDERRQRWFVLTSYPETAR